MLTWSTFVGHFKVLPCPWTWVLLECFSTGHQVTLLLCVWGVGGGEGINTNLVDICRPLQGTSLSLDMDLVGMF